jgi:hypothetical protein
VIHPTVIVTGDKNKGYELKKFALQQLSTLERLMSFQKLNEGYRTVQPYPGSGIVVECWSSFSLRVVKVHVPTPEGEAGGRAKEKEERYCLCFPHFSVAEVLDVFPKYPVKNVDPNTGLEFSENQEQFDQREEAYLEELPLKRFSYDLAICDGDDYLIFLDAKDSNLGLYVKGQFVLATLADTFPDGSTDCARSCLLDPERFVELTISPLSIAGGIEEWITRGKTWERM